MSASTAKVVDVIDTRTGEIVARIPSGDQPHENNFSKDSKLVYHASIGTVYTPLDDPALDASKGERVFEVIDASNWQVLRKIDMGQKLDEFGEPDMSGAVRPMAARQADSPHQRGRPTRSACAWARSARACSERRSLSAGASPVPAGYWAGDV